MYCTEVIAIGPLWLFSLGFDSVMFGAGEVHVATCRCCVCVVADCGTDGRSAASHDGRHATTGSGENTSTLVLTWNLISLTLNNFVYLNATQICRDIEIFDQFYPLARQFLHQHQSSP